jgi:pimeloyl-ACP methyl ester carboxylesterase
MTDLLRVDGRSRDDMVGDVVFVHGLGGSADATWRRRRGALWPSLVANEHTDLAVWTLGYRNPAFGRGILSLDKQASAALDELRSEGLGDRPLVLIGHSRGGLLAKQMLAPEKVDEELSRATCAVVGVVFV